MNKNRKSAKIRLKKQQQQTMLNWSVIINCASWCKEGGLRKTRILPHAKMQLVPINCFLWRVDYALEKNVLTEQMWIFAAYFILRGRDTCIDFLPLFKALHCGWLSVLGCVISPKCLLDLNNSKPFSFCPWMSLFPAMFCHAGPSSLAFLAGWFILTDRD